MIKNVEDQLIALSLNVLLLSKGIDFSFKKINEIYQFNVSDNDIDVFNEQLDIANEWPPLIGVIKHITGMKDPDCLYLNQEGMQIFREIKDTDTSVLYTSKSGQPLSINGLEEKLCL